MKIELLSNTKNKDISISNDVFSKEFNESLIHQAVVSFMAASRQGSAKQKNRSEVRGGGKKPYRQKGTGRARAGTIRSPLWRGGGVTFAARPRDYSKKLNKKMYRAAIKSIFSELVRQNRLVAIEKPVLEKPKTKEIASFLNEFSLSKVLIIIDELDMNLYLSARNIPNVDVITVREINPVNLLKPQKVAVTSEALKQIEEWING
ncbi:MAG: ribosomal protein, L4/L1 family [SAR86 cluster bacterium SAR86A]|jgi:large subunit ribosomal protein L4|uniref:Large ribosomal subunit protein uL4 n=1 Tax=SAR86 cluster bacterium SAR86A TaxID=1123866 RepID=J4UYN4_9GAMM|nr:MAG: ribosomal protein, L4/L1 family [SAR86 cluster bacterium SAR86A]MAN85125.1 50S ribosomal protein L4 [Gammaproteobacteria bacterium]MEC7773709.1 50S ribosomal protein L4 [Pseudomonadota bacterium]MEC8131547.1 50S ribosomal protein L4 [Pseudomonadota bacterium]|tara:strand:- start:416 stop:1030 length:615 start_codon:yes stop_codon:yes gene_type:complete